MEPASRFASHMKRAILILLLHGGTLAGADIPLDPQKPPLLKPSSVYSFSITPKDGIEPATIRLHTEASDQFKTAEGIIFAPIGKITVRSKDKEYELEYDYVDVGIPNMDIADFDGDGFLDFRIITAWGTGGSWYCYYRFKDGAFHRWKEPEELGLNSLPDGGEMVAYGRSGPENFAIYYQHKDGRFQKQRSESILLKDSLPELKNWKTNECVTVFVIEEWNDNRLIRRTLEPQYGPK